MNSESMQIADLIIKCIDEKKGFDIVLMDMEGVSILCDYFIIASGSSRPHTRAISEHIETRLKEVENLPGKRIQGRNDAGWILMDYGAVVVHIFLENLREYYNLEELWTRERRLLKEGAGEIITEKKNLKPKPRTREPEPVAPEQKPRIRNLKRRIIKQ